MSIAHAPVSESSVAISSAPRATAGSLVPGPQVPNGRRSRYPSDVDDATWADAAKVLPAVPAGRGRQREVNLRDVVNALNYRWHTQCVWRMLPHDFPKWQTVYKYFHLWHRSGVLWRLRAVLLAKSKLVTLPHSDFENLDLQYLAETSRLNGERHLVQPPAAV